MPRDSPERLELNEKLKDIVVSPKDRFNITPVNTQGGYVIDYKKKGDRFPPGVNTLNNRVSYFEPKTVEQLKMIDNAIRVSRNTNFKIRKDGFYYKAKDSKLPRYLLCDGGRNQLDQINNDKGIQANNYSNCNFYINPIGRQNNKERLQKSIQNNDIRTLLMKHGYLKAYQGVKSPVREYIHYKKDIFAAVRGLFSNNILKEDL